MQRESKSGHYLIFQETATTLLTHVTITMTTHASGCSRVGHVLTVHCDVVIAVSYIEHNLKKLHLYKHKVNLYRQY